MARKTGMLETKVQHGSGLDTFWARRLVRCTRPVVLVAGMISATGLLASASAQSGIPDSQVEANVMRSLAGAPELATESIASTTVGGVVTLSGAVKTEAARSKAEQLVSTTVGVKKVVDELQLGSAAASSVPTPAQQSGPAPDPAPGPGMVLQSDGTYAPAGQAGAGSTQGPGSAPAGAAQRNDPDNDAALDQQMDQKVNPQYQAGGGQTPQAGTTPQQPQQNANGYPQQSYPQQGYPQQGYPQQRYPQQNYPQQTYPQAGYPQYPQQSRGYAQAPNGQPVWGGQQAGQAVVVPAGAMIRVRVNKTLASNRTKPGTNFDGIVLNDVTAGGFVAIPRGAAVTGTVVDAKSSGALTGRGELSIQLTAVTLGGKQYPIVSDVWAHNGGDKTIETINKTAGLGAVGAVFGALAGGGVGAAVGGGIGAAAGLGSSAASGRGQVIIPSEGVVSFTLAQQAPVQTVSEQEMQRLSYGVSPGADPRLVRRPGYYPYYGPGPYYGANGPYGPGPSYGYPAPPNQ